MRALFAPVLLLALTACTGAPAPDAGASGGTTAATSQPTTADPHAGMDHDKGGDAAAFKALSGASIAFGEPADGASVTSPVKVVMQVTGAQVKPAGELVEGSGHHHVIVDGEPVAAGTVVPKDDTHIHYGDGSTETELELAPGEHTLTLQFADGMHRSYGPDVSATIKVTVTE